MEATRPLLRKMDSSQMTMQEHLRELRMRLMVSLSALLVGMTIAFFISDVSIAWLKALMPDTVRFVQLTPGEALMASFKVSLMVGALLASPVILYHVMRFIIPGLTAHERGLLFWIILGGAVLFMAGGWFAYEAVLPPALFWLMDYGQNIAESWMSIGRYIDFCMSFILLCGVSFELPMVLLFLSMAGIVNSRQLLSQWRWVIVAIVLGAGILTPSQDPLSMALVAVAMTGLYFFSLIPMRLLGK